MTDQKPTVSEVLTAPRVRWKFNHDTEWRYGRPVGYTDQPVFIIERETDGQRVGVLASFDPRPTPVPEPSGEVPENWEQIQALARVLATAGAFGTGVGVTEFAQAEAALKYLAAVQPPTREQIDTAVGRVLFNASNFPGPAAPHILGQDIGPLRAKVTDAVLALFPQPTPSAESSLHDAWEDGYGTGWSARDNYGDPDDEEDYSNPYPVTPAEPDIEEDDR